MLDADELFLVTTQPDAYRHLGFPVHGDVIKEKGALGGIYSAIHYSSNHYVLTVACDLPFIRPQLLLYLLELCEAGDSLFDAIVPRVKNYPQGLIAVYSKTCLEPIKTCIDANRLQVIGFYPQVHTRYVDEPEYAAFDPKGLSFFNVNTPQDLEQAQQIDSV